MSFPFNSTLKCILWSLCSLSFVLSTGFYIYGHKIPPRRILKVNIVAYENNRHWEQERGRKLLGFVCVLGMRESEHRNSMCDLWCERTWKNKNTWMFIFFSHKFIIENVHSFLYYRGAMKLIERICRGYFGWNIYWNTCSLLVHVYCALITQCCTRILYSFFFGLCTKITICISAVCTVHLHCVPKS